MKEASGNAKRLRTAVNPDIVIKKVEPNRLKARFLKKKRDER